MIIYCVQPMRNLLLAMILSYDPILYARMYTVVISKVSTVVAARVMSPYIPIPPFPRNTRNVGLSVMANPNSK